MTPMNPMQMLGMIKKSGNPQAFVLNILDQNMKDTPFYNNLKGLIQNKDSKGLEEFARNYVNSQGGDFDKDFNNFKNSLKF
jgi:hypothetical protein